MLVPVLSGASVLVACCSLAVLRTHGLPRHQFYGLMSISNVLVMLSQILGSSTSATVSAGFVALTGWLWWMGGGGDDTKRRLRLCAGRFQGIRRTAPVSVTS